MGGSSENPFEPPAANGDLTINSSPAKAGEVASVTFRISIDDLRRASSSGFSPIAMTGFIVVLGMIGVSLAVWPSIRNQGWTADSVRLLSISALPVLALIGAIMMISLRKLGRGVSEAPFETTVTLSPTGLLIREAGIAELRRSWSSIAGVSHNRHQIRFDLLMFDTSMGRFVTQPGPIVPLRAFHSEADASSFFATARGLIDAAGSLQDESPSKRR